MTPACHASRIRKAFPCFEPELVEGNKTEKGVLRQQVESPGRSCPLLSKLSFNQKYSILIFV